MRARMAVLGKLQKIDLRNIWDTESGHFTPWLAAENSMLQLAPFSLANRLNELTSSTA